MGPAFKGTPSDSSILRRHRIAWPTPARGLLIGFEVSFSLAFYDKPTSFSLNGRGNKTILYGPLRFL